MSNFSEGNFLQCVKQITTGSNAGQATDGGFLRDLDIIDRFTSTNFTASTYTPFNLVSTGVSTSFYMAIPRDYDTTSDNFMLRLIGSTSTVGNPTITIGAAINLYAPGTSTASTLTAQTSSTVVNTSTITNFGVELSGNNLTYGDVLTITMSTTGGQFGLLGVLMTYSSCLVAFADYPSPVTSTSVVVTETVNGSTYELRTR